MAQPERRHGFGLRPDDILADKYVIVEKLGSGWESEVYLVREKVTGIERSVKLFFPARNPGNRALRRHARKMHKLRDCPILSGYHTQESVELDGEDVSFLVSEYIDGELLSRFVKRQPGHRLEPFQGLLLLHELARGIETIHDMRDYHGDLHSDNVLVRRRGLGFSARLVDIYHWGPPSAENIQEDVYNLVRIFHEILGGAARYAKHPPEVKAICCGLKRTLIRRKFRNAGRLRKYLETMEWTSR